MVLGQDLRWRREPLPPDWITATPVNEPDGAMVQNRNGKGIKNITQQGSARRWHSECQSGTNPQQKGPWGQFFEILRVYRSAPSLELQAHVVRVIEKESAQGHRHGQTDTKGHPTDGLQGRGEVNGEASSENPVKNLELG